MVTASIGTEPSASLPYVRSLARHSRGLLAMHRSGKQPVGFTSKSEQDRGVTTESIEMTKGFGMGMGRMVTEPPGGEKIAK